MLVDLWRSVDPIDPIYNKVYFSNSLCLCVSIKKGPSVSKRDGNA